METFSQLIPVACVPEQIRTEHFSNVRRNIACAESVDCRNRDLALCSCLQVNARIVLVSFKTLRPPLFISLHIHSHVSKCQVGDKNNKELEMRQMKTILV